jgi:hypothetical protein
VNGTATGLGNHLPSSGEAQGQMSLSDCGNSGEDGTAACKRPLYGNEFNWRVSVRGRAGSRLLSPRWAR